MSYEVSSRRCSMESLYGYYCLYDSLQEIWARTVESTRVEIYAWMLWAYTYRGICILLRRVGCQGQNLWARCFVVLD